MMTVRQQLSPEAYQWEAIAAGVVQVLRANRLGHFLAPQWDAEGAYLQTSAVVHLQDSPMAVGQMMVGRGLDNHQQAVRSQIEGFVDAACLTAVACNYFLPTMVTVRNYGGYESWDAAYRMWGAYEPLFDLGCRQQMDRQMFS